jgi:hypothetical protein
MIANIKNAGIEAMTHLTMKKTIDINGILISVTITRISSSFIIFPLSFQVQVQIFIN